LAGPPAPVALARPGPRRAANFQFSEFFRRRGPPGPPLEQRLTTSPPIPNPAPARGYRMRLIHPKASGNMRRVEYRATLVFSGIRLLRVPLLSTTCFSKQIPRGLDDLAELCLAIRPMKTRESQPDSLPTTPPNFLAPPFVLITSLAAVRGFRNALTSPRSRPESSRVGACPPGWAGLRLRKRSGRIWGVGRLPDPVRFWPRMRPG